MTVKFWSIAEFLERPINLGLNWNIKENSSDERSENEERYTESRGMKIGNPKNV
jgi:hypothetical protein